MERVRKILLILVIAIAIIVVDSLFLHLIKWGRVGDFFIWIGSLIKKGSS